MNKMTAVTQADHLVDIATADQGSPSNENTIINNLMGPGGLGRGTPYHYIFPLGLPAGQRIMARTQATAVNATLEIALSAFQGAGQTCGQIVTIGDQTGDSGGGAVGFNVSANVEGTYALLGVSPANKIIREWWFAIGVQNLGSITSQVGLLDIGISPVGVSPQNITPLITDFYIRGGAGTDHWYPNTAGPFLIPIPPNHEIYSRMQAGGASTHTADLIIYGAV